MTANKFLLFSAPVILMVAITVVPFGLEHGVTSLVESDSARLMAGRAAIAAPYVLAAGAGIIFLLASAGARHIRYAGLGVTAGGIATIAIALMRETVRLSAV